MRVICFSNSQSAESDISAVLVDVSCDCIVLLWPRGDSRRLGPLADKLRLDYYYEAPE